MISRWKQEDRISDFNDKEDNFYNYTIDYLKAIAIFLVILGHAVSYYMKNSQETSTAVRIAYILIYSVHVPLFFMIAGYLNHEQNFQIYLWKKIKRILVPFIVFSILKIIYSNIISNSFSHGNNLRDQLIDAFIIGNLYWFIYTIFIIYLIAPLMWGKRDSKNFLLKFCIFFILAFAVNAYGAEELVNYFQIFNVIHYLPFFYTGYILKRYGNFFSKQIKDNAFHILIICILLMFVGTILKIFDIDITYAGHYLYVLSLCVLLYFVCINISAKIQIMKIIAAYSLQLMYLDSFFKVLLFAIVMKSGNLNLITVFLVTIVNVFLGCVTCIIAEKIPIICTLMGLEYKKIEVHNEDE